MSSNLAKIPPYNDVSENAFIGGAKDVFEAIKEYSLIGMLGWQDVRQRYQRSIIGPFWLTISMAVMIGTIGLVFGQIFNSKMDEFLPFLAIGMIAWGFVSTTINEGCTGFIAAESMIKQLPLPLFFHILRVIWRNFIITLHNLIIVPAILIIFGKSIGPSIFLVIPGLIIASINIAWVTLFLGLICTRYRDIPQIVTSGLQILFYLTPIMWMPSLLPHHARVYLLDANPLYHAIEIIRGPILGTIPTAVNWNVSIAIAIIGWLVTFYAYGKLKHRVAYWL